MKEGKHRKNTREKKHVLHVRFRKMVVVHVELAVAGAGSVAAMDGVPVAGVGLVVLEHGGPAVVQFLGGG